MKKKDPGKIYRYLYWKYTNAQENANIIRIFTPFDPVGKEVENWIEGVRKCLNTATSDWNSNPVPDNADHNLEFEVHFQGRTASIHDGLKIVIELFPWMVGITLVIILLLTSVVFQSLFLPVRLLFTIGATLSFSYGFSIIVFQNGIFDYLFPSKTVDSTSFYWFAPIVAFSVIPGLTLDYDIFLFSRVYEYRYLFFFLFSLFFFLIF